MNVEVNMSMGSWAHGEGDRPPLFPRYQVPAKNLVGPSNGGLLVFNRMMIPERLTTAAGPGHGAVLSGDCDTG